MAQNTTKPTLPTNEEELIKNIFLVTINPAEKAYEYLPSFQKQLQLIKALALPNLFQPAPPEQDEEWIPCEICNQQWPLDRLISHQERCMTGIKENPPIKLPKFNLSSLLPPASTTPPTLDVSVVGPLITEKLKLFGTNEITNGGKYLLACFDRSKKLEQSLKDSNAELSAKAITCKEKILETCRKMLSTEQQMLLKARSNRGMVFRSAILEWLDALPTDFLSDLCKSCKEDELALIFTAVFIALSVAARQSSRTAMTTDEMIPHLKNFVTLINDPILCEYVSHMLAKEIDLARSQTARQIENTSVLLGMLLLTPIYNLDPKNIPMYFSRFFGTSYPDAVSSNEVLSFRTSLQSKLRPVWDAVTTICKKIFSHPLGTPKETLLTWIATILQLNESRSTLNPHDPLYYELAMVAGSDPASINLFAVLLQLCAPFMIPKPVSNNPSSPTSPTTTLKSTTPGNPVLVPPGLQGVNSAFPTSSLRYDWSKFPRLGTSTSSESANFVFPNSTSPTNFNFITEIFFATMYALHNLFLPAKNQYSSLATTFSKLKDSLEKLENKLGGKEVSKENSDWIRIKTNYTKIYELADCYQTHILHPTIIENLLHFLNFFTLWMFSTLDSQNILANFPEFFIRDWAESIIFLARTRPASFPTTGTGDLAPRAADLAVSLLALGAAPYLSNPSNPSKENSAKNPISAENAGKIAENSGMGQNNQNNQNNNNNNLNNNKNYILFKNPILRASLVGILAEFSHIGKQYKQNNNPSLLIGNLIPANLLGTHFSRAVVENVFVQKDAAVGLLGIYVDASIVEGLDVDKENFDKYSVRASITHLLNDLWDAPVFRESLATLANSKGPGKNLLSKFIGTVLNDSIHLLEDSLGRLQDIKMLQTAMADIKEWTNQDPEFKRERESYYDIQENSARSFLNLANLSLDLLEKLAAHEIIKMNFLGNFMGPRTAAMANHFMEALCGPKCKNLKVQNPEKYNFNPKNLLAKISRIILHFGIIQEFSTTLSRDADFNLETFKKANYFLNREKILSPILLENFSTFVNFLENSKNIPTSVPMEIENSQKIPNSKSEISPEFSNNNSSLNNNNNNPNKMEIEFSEPPENSSEISATYLTTLTPLLFDTCDMGTMDDPPYIRHHYSAQINQGGIVSQQKITKLSKEISMLPTSLPINQDSSIFVRADDERIDVMRALIIGPMDTPYAMGCFQFDIYFPPSYPLDPPLVNLETTGNGTVRFNPNLYNCGKVCLSLLGTWHGDGSSTTKWNPNSSNIYQVLVSIQGLIMIPQPYFNEPAYEAQRGTKEGEMRSQEYSENIRLGTIRHAMISQLRNPSEGFEEIIKKHFFLLKKKIFSMVGKWVAEVNEENVEMKMKMKRAMDDLKIELDKLNG